MGVVVEHVEDVEYGYEVMKVNGIPISFIKTLGRKMA